MRRKPFIRFNVVEQHAVKKKDIIQWFTFKDLHRSLHQIQVQNIKELREIKETNHRERERTRRGKREAYFFRPDSVYSSSSLSTQTRTNENSPRAGSHRAIIITCDTFRFICLSNIYIRLVLKVVWSCCVQCVLNLNATSWRSLLCTVSIKGFVRSLSQLQLCLLEIMFNLKSPKRNITSTGLGFLFPSWWNVVLILNSCCF